MDPNANSSIEDFVKGMYEVSSKLHALQPDYIIAPMVGAIPFIDVLCIIDEHFENEKVLYLPASNKIKGVRTVIRNWFGNMLRESYVPGSDLKMVSIDEVISGNSLVRSLKQAEAAIQDVANERMEAQLAQILERKSPKEIQAILSGELRKRLREEIASKISYFPIGIVDEGKRAKKKSANREWLKLVSEGKTDSVSVMCIPTMDRPDFFPITYKPISGESLFYPLVETFKVSPEYVTFLQRVAGISGKDPQTVTLMNMSRILESKRYLS